MKKFCTSTFHSNGHISETKQDGNVKSSSHSRTETILPSHFSTLFIATFITAEARGDGKRSQQRVVEVTTLHLTGVHLTFPPNLCDIPHIARHLGKSANGFDE